MIFHPVVIPFRSVENFRFMTLCHNWESHIGFPMLLLLVTELILGLFAFGFNPLFDLHALGYNKIATGYQDNFQFLTAIRFLFSFLLLIGPCILIGGTIPLFIKLMGRDLEILGRQSAWIYGINNLGAAIGCLLTGFFLIQHMGITKSLHLGGIMNVFNGCILFILFLAGIHPQRLIHPINKIEEKSDRLRNDIVSKKLITLLLVVFAVEGFTTLSYEVIWDRILTEFSYDKSTYLDALIIFVFIFGLAIGSFIISFIQERKWNAVKIVGWLEVGIAFFSLSGLFAASQIMPVLAERQVTADTWFKISVIEYITFTGFMLFPVILMGITFPVVLKIYVQHMKNVGNRTGNIGLLDTVGSIAGSFAAGFILIPVFGTMKSFYIIVTLNLIMGIVLLILSTKIILKPVLYLSFILSVMFVFVAVIPSNGMFKTRIAKREGEKLRYYKEGASGTVSVHSFGNGHQALAINGALFAYSTTDDLRSHRLLAYLPYMIHPDPDTVLVIGYGMGITGSSFIQEDIESITIAEINPYVVQAALQHFSQYSYPITQSPKVRLVLDDGLSLIQSGDIKYDIITCDAMHPRLGNYLYTSDFYDLVYNKLSENGIICMWMPFNWISEDDYKSALNAFINQFNNSTLWYVNRGVNLLVGSKGNIMPDFNQIYSSFENKETLYRMAEADVFNPEMLIGRLLYGEPSIDIYANGIESNDFEFSRIEFSTEPALSPNLDVLDWLQASPGKFEELLIHLPDTGSLNYKRIMFHHQMICNEIRQEIDWISGGQ